ncbi:D-alanyl-D-alanine carboxypeptidase/D-alanyl-D-alanine-endopeptidase [Isoptericola halotolerans]|uniref:D-alanyl-D-alanine carboxypeptidase/D-alanyl-D-alanine-endopeptidase (Penicillin-binding protein 4) n=1 Tax=Isoptericola halotolerans TaxID=300560 RepID=A0ABX2A6K8_9MICO|nr:D-alanyl-D-alanine carboxypeptidase/D-alanyl-D-alanine-endopeptidase [Isoptericola halotolerans]NOV97228.1 D-alanyl-D-alanine carboxypeptidase/D-alanyl-D-alanine-endopeptidase (penicillin-binding protein 4) [Isoptericola halotolerans]
MGWRLRVGATVTTVVALFGGYLVADAYDVVPGMVTLQPAPEPAAPFPTAPGAVDGPSPVVAVPALSEDAPVPSASAVDDLVEDLADDDRLGNRVGVMVSDVGTGATLGASGQDRFLVPASTQKILTAVAAYSGPGGDTRLVTRVMLHGDNQLVLVGGGDMMLAAGDGDPEAVNGRAGLGDLADQVVARIALTGIDTVTLAVDDTLFTGPAIPPSVRANDARDGYTAPVAALAVDMARLTDDKYAPREEDPALAAGRSFADALADRGVEVTGSIVRQTAPSSATELGRVESASLGELVGYLLRESDNTLTEVVGRLVAIDAGLPGSGEAAVSEVMSEVESLGVDLSGAELTDLSGLGTGSRLSARQLVDTLLVAAADPELRESVTGLPVAGLQGTLSDRFGGDNPGRGYAEAKTGSLPDVRSLAGTVVTADDRLLVFAVTADRIPEGGSFGANLIFDDFVGDLADCGCS